MRVVAIGEEAKLAGYALAGVELVDAVEAGRVRTAWAEVADDVGLVLLTPEARLALPERLERGGLLWVVVP